MNERLKRLKESCVDYSKFAAYVFSRRKDLYKDFFQKQVEQINQARTKEALDKAVETAKREGKTVEEIDKGITGYKLAGVIQRPKIYSLIGEKGLKEPSDGLPSGDILYKGDK